MTERCPICGKEAPPRPGNLAAPFCSERCRLVDLGRWLSEEYRIPAERAGDGSAGKAEDEGGR
jgi:endogenous inhibitor of DNA gyrase (YacG/DUF329 family)